MHAHIKHLCLIGFAGLFTSGCFTVGPDYEPPAVDLPDAWSLTVEEQFKNGSPALETWWDLLGDDVLKQMIARGGRESPTVRAAYERIEEARAIRRGARSRFFPQLDGSGSVAYTRASEETAPFLPEGIEREESLYTVGVDVGWELDLFGRVRRSVEAADASIEAAVEDYRDTLVLLYADIGTTYIEARTLQERVRLAKANANRQMETLRLTRDRNNAGLVPNLDVAQAELLLAGTSAAIPALRAALVQTMNRLSVLVGAHPSFSYDMLNSDGAGAIPTPPGDLVVGLPSDLLRQRPDVRRAERQLAAQTARIGVATAELYPIFSLPGSFQLEALDPGDLGGDSLAYGFGPAFRWSLFSAGRVRGAIQAEESRTRQAFHAYQQTLLLALEDVESAMVGYLQERQRASVLRMAVDAARRSVDMVKTLYTSGLVDFQNVLDSERSLFTQEDALAESEGLALQDLVRLYKALGGGWSTMSDTPPPPAEEPET